MNAQLKQSIEKYIKANEALEEAQSNLTKQYPDMDKWSHKDERWSEIDSITQPLQKIWQESRDEMFKINVNYCAKNFNKYAATRIKLVQTEAPTAAAQLLVDMYNKS